MFCDASGMCGYYYNFQYNQPFTRNSYFLKEIALARNFTPNVSIELH